MKPSFASRAQNTELVLVHGFMQDASAWDEVVSVLRECFEGAIHTPTFDELYTKGRAWVAHRRAHAWEYPDLMLPLGISDLGYLGFGLRAYLEELRGEVADAVEHPGSLTDGSAYAIAADSKSASAVSDMQFCLVGYSMGGRIVMQFLHDAREGSSPEAYRSSVCGQVSQVILESAGLGPHDADARSAMRERNASWQERFEQMSPEETVAFWEGLPLFAYERELSAEQQECTHQMRLRSARAGHPARWVARAGAHLMPDFGECSEIIRACRDEGVEISYVTGSFDAKYQKLAAELTGYGVRIKTIEGGHNTHACNPRAFSEYILHQLGI